MKSSTRWILLFTCSLAAVLVGTWMFSDRRKTEGTILFLGWDDAGMTQLYAVDASGENFKKLTSTEGGINDFAISPDGERIVYSSNARGGGSELWQLVLRGGKSRMMLSCADADCRAPVWHPDGIRILYERRTIDQSDVPQHPSLWWLDTTSGMTIPLLQDPAAYGQSATFSPAGDWIGYVAGPGQGLRLYNLETGESQLIPSSVGSPAVWSPDGQSLLTRDRHLVILHGDEGEDHLGHTHQYGESVALFLTELSTFNTTRLGGDDVVDDGPPAWSPDGSWIAFGRKSPRTQDGRQLWLIRPDGGDARPLTHAPHYHHGAISWSRDGKMLLFQRLDVRGGNEKPGIWLLNLETNQEIEVHTPGFLPAWLQ